MIRILILFMQLMMISIMSVLVATVWKGLYDVLGVVYICLTFIVVLTLLAMIEQIVRALQEIQPTDDARENQKRSIDKGELPRGFHSRVNAISLSRHP